MWWLVSELGQFLLWLIAIPVGLVLAGVVGYFAFTRLALWCFRLVHVARGRDLLIVYSNSPNWQAHVEREWLPRWSHRAVVLNWSERKRWSRLTPAVLLFRAFTDYRAFTPIAMVVPRWWGGPTVVPFWQAFRDLKHGNSVALRHAERQLEEALRRKPRHARGLTVLDAEILAVPMNREEIIPRPIVAADAPTVADLHTTSWRSAYRGMLRDEYLDGDIAVERRQVWAARLAAPVHANYGFIAESDAGPVGFVYLLGGADATWGTLVDNLHVVPGMKGRGIGRRLLAAAAHETLRRFPNDGVYLYVFEANLAARGFYASIGGREVERGVVEPPGGGSQVHWRVAWNGAGQLLAFLGKEPR